MIVPDAAAPHGERVKVLDFGIAKLLAPDIQTPNHRIDPSSGVTRAGTFIGTPAYMSPEQFMGQIVDGRSDIFSAGVVLYQFLTGERPFTGGATTIMHKVLNEHPPAPSMLSVQVPRLFDAVIAKAMEKRPDDRFEVARQFKQAIALAAEGNGGPEFDQLLGSASDATVVNLDTQKTVKIVADAPTMRQSPPAGDGGWRTVGGGGGESSGSGGAGGGQPPANIPAPAVNPGGPAAEPVAAKSTGRKSPLLLLGGLLLALLIVGGAIAVMLARSLPHAELDKAADAMVKSLEKEAQKETPEIVGAASPTEPGTMLISAVGLADPGDKKYQSDKALLNADLRADSKSQLIEKAIALYLDRTSLDKNYALLRDRLMAKSSGYILNIVSESEPQLGKDGLMHVTTQATVKVRDVQKSLNDMARDERIDFIRNNGDPRISVSISVRGEGADAPAQNSQVAENLLKERIKSFGFRIVSDDAQAKAALGKDVAVAALDDIGMKKLSANLAKSGIKLDKLIDDDATGAATPGKGPDFAVVGEARIKKLSAKLPASGITVEKYLLTSWTVKCIDTQSGEEIYYNNKLPVAAGSWATEEQALAAIGDEFSRDFFLQHFAAGGQQVRLKFEGLPDQVFQQAVARELVGLEQVINLAQHSKGGESAIFDLNLSGSGPLNDLVAGAVLKPLNAKLGKPCFDLGAIAGNRISVNFDKACRDPAVISRFDVNPPASLYEAPSIRQNWVLKDPNAVKKLSM
jgi:serine/threonine-protein kinase